MDDSCVTVKSLTMVLSTAIRWAVEAVEAVEAGQTLAAYYSAGAIV